MSLLQRLQQHGEQAAWVQFVDLFSPPLFLWACRAGLQGEEAADLVRGVLDLAARKLPEYRPSPPGGFRGWLRGLAHQRRAELIRRRQPADPAAEAVPPGADAVWNAEYLTLLLGPALDQLQPHFPANEWKACWGTAVEGRPVADVARETGMSLAALHIASGKVLRRLRQEMDGLLD